jgi:hypothetical protein
VTLPVRRRTLKLIALGYAVKTLLVGIAWVLIPDLPDRAVSLVLLAFVD